MKCLATIKLKIPKNPKLIQLFDSYRQACQYACDIAHKQSVKYKFDLHHLVYTEMRERFNLKSQFVINAIARGFETYKSAIKLKGRKPTFKSVPVRFDRRTFTFLNDKVSLATNDKRCIIPLDIPEYYWKYLDWKYQTADLCMIKHTLYLNITFSREVNAYTSCSETLGVDLGVNNLAVCSDGQVFTGHKTKIMQYHYLRKRLQAKGTKSAKRLLKKVSGRQKRYMAWVNHIVSKKIVSSADIIVLEDIKGIRKSRNKYRSKRLNRWLNSWSFYQLGQFITYKAEREGKRVIKVNPYMTSQTCSACERIGSRYFDSFVCQHCGFSSQADFNASCNLRRLSVTQPNSSDDDVKGTVGATATEFRAKSPVL